MDTLEILYGTRNLAKINSMKKMLKNLDIKIISLNDINVEIGTIHESGNSPLENARIKALAYYKVWKKPIFSCDSGLYIHGINPSSQPGVHVRRVNGKELNDEEMIDYYTRLALNLGGEAKAKYKNAICLIKRNEGFPLDSISKDIETDKYYMDLTYYTANEESMINGFRNFFIRSLNL